MKICVTGYSGAGKSTLAKILGKKYNLPVLCYSTIGLSVDDKPIFLSAR